MDGVEHYEAASGFHCVRLHYSADPEKNPFNEKGKKWLENELKGIPGGIASAQWRQEYEIDWDAAGGELCFPQFDVYKQKIVVRPFAVPESWALYGSFDYGHRNPSSFHVYAVDFDSNIWSVWEYYKSGQGYRQIAKAIRDCPYFKRLAYLPIADPSIWAKTQQSIGASDQNEMKSIAQLFYELAPEEQIIFAPGKSGGDITVAEKINGDLWNQERLANGGEPRFKIFASCPMQVWEFAKLRYRDWSGPMQEYRNLQESIVDKDNHSFDDFKMFMTMFFMAPAQGTEDPLEKLKKEDYPSYVEWKAVREMHGEELSGKSSLGDFE